MRFGMLIAIVLVAIVLALSGGLISTQTALAAGACAPSSFAGADKSAANRKAARVLALRDWRNRVASSRGPSWSQWNAAQGKSLKCRSNQDGTTQCQARAVPCRDMSGASGGKYKLVR